MNYVRTCISCGHSAHMRRMVHAFFGGRLRIEWWCHACAVHGAVEDVCSRLRRAGIDDVAERVEAIHLPRGGADGLLEALRPLRAAADGLAGEHRRAVLSACRRVVRAVREIRRRAMPAAAEPRSRPGPRVPSAPERAPLFDGPPPPPPAQRFDGCAVCGHSRCECRARKRERELTEAVAARRLPPPPPPPPRERVPRRVGPPAPARPVAVAAGNVLEAIERGGPARRPGKAGAR